MFSVLTSALGLPLLAEAMPAAAKAAAAPALPAEAHGYPALTFTFGLLILALFGWYFSTEIATRKRALGLALTVLLVVVCAVAIYPPDKKIALGLDLAGGTEFLIRLVKSDKDIPISPRPQEIAVEVIRSRVDRFGVGEPVISPVGADSILVQIPGLEPEKNQGSARHAPAGRASWSSSSSIRAASR